MSEGKHFHCPKCDRVCRERSVTVNHVWRCLQAEKLPPEDDPIDIDDAEDYELEESLLKVCLIFELADDKSNKITCAPSQDSDQPGNLPSDQSLCCPHEEGLGP